MAPMSSNAVRILFFLMTVVCVVHAGKPASKEKDENSAKDEKSAAGGDGIFDISKLGGKGDGKTDSTKAMVEAFTSACEKEGHSTILVPKGDYLIGALNFTGPCKGPLTIQLDGNLLGTEDLTQYKGNWIEIVRVHNLEITGKGTLDGQGPKVWTHNKCDKKYDCKILPNSLVLDYIENSTVSGITILNAKFFHMNIFECKGVTVKNVKVTAPEDSPNTDGIHMGDSSDISIIDTVIGVGDDCISIGPGTKGVNISGVTCGPGHGISIGSLGRYKDEKDVTDVTVKDCTIKNTSNGLRIKSYEDSHSVLTCSKIHYENVKVDNVGYPIIIDMKYCPNNICPAKGSAKVTVKDVSFKNITGTSSTPEAINIICSDKIPCTDITMNDIKVEYMGTNNKTMAVCKNAKGSITGGLKELDCF